VLAGPYSEGLIPWTAPPPGCPAYQALPPVDRLQPRASDLDKLVYLYFCVVNSVAINARLFAYGAVVGCG